MPRSITKDEHTAWPQGGELGDKPWLDASGKILDDESLRRASAHWSPAVWERYLQTLDVGVKEQQPFLVEDEKHGRFLNIWDFGPGEVTNTLTKEIERLLSTLTERQQTVIKKIFWDGLSERQTARIMGISRQGVFDLKRRAIRGLKRNARQALANSPRVRKQILENINPNLAALLVQSMEVSSC